MSAGDKVQYQLTYRQATPEDIPFLVEVIINAESGSHGRISYQKIFDLSDNELRMFLSTMLGDETPDHELTYQSYILAELDGKIVGGLAAFVEGADGIPSKMIKANLMARAAGVDRWREARPILEKLAQLDIDRTPGSLQLEYGFVLPNLKAKGVMTGIHHHIMVTFKKRFPELEIAECQSTIDNIGLRKLNRVGWVDYKILRSDDPEVLEFTSSNTRLVRRFYYRDFEGGF